MKAQKIEVTWEDGTKMTYDTHGQLYDAKQVKCAMEAIIATMKANS